MNVYTYYTHVPELWSDDSQRALIELWKRSWTKHGWNPVIVTEEDAKRHPRYADFKDRFWKFPTPHGANYGGGCFMRWVALSVVGGGLMVDYDVINYGFTPRMSQLRLVDVSVGRRRPVVEGPHLMKVYCDGAGPIWCGAIQAPADLYETMSMLFYRWPVNEGEWLPDKGIYHCEDQVFMRRLFDRPDRLKLRWLKRVRGCTLYPDLSGPMVHYPTAFMLADNRWPKHEHIEKLRAI